MNSIHILIPELFLTDYFTPDIYADLHLPALLKLLSYGSVMQVGKAMTMEDSLHRLFGPSRRDPAPIAEISAMFDGLPRGHWLRADPTHLSLQRDQLLLSPVLLTPEEAQRICHSLNEHYLHQGMTFFTPHPQRWYVRLDHSPQIVTTPWPELVGRDVRKNLPHGAEATFWCSVFNEIQMLLYTHSVNLDREDRGEATVNSLWLWGQGKFEDDLAKNYQNVSSDNELLEMFSAAADIQFSDWNNAWRVSAGKQLLVWTGLRSAKLKGDWLGSREALLSFELGYAQPIWQALKRREISQVKVEILTANRSLTTTLGYGATLKFWKSSKTLDRYSTF